MIPTLIIMVKDPKPGRVKTRLGRDIGIIPATWWYRHQLRTLIRRLRDPRWETVLAVSPDRSQNFRNWTFGLPTIPQGTGDLGERMDRCLHVFGPKPVVLIGSDIPSIRKHHIADAFGKLGPTDIVFGPAKDGGFWLVGLQGLQSHRAGIFSAVRWSSEHALSDSLAGVRDLRVGLAETLRDVDGGKDL